MIRPLAVAALAVALGAPLAGAQSPRRPSLAPAPLPAATPATEAGWIRRGGAQLQVLDKVNARSKILNLRDGEQAEFGSLTISLRSCLVRAPDQPADAAAFLVMAELASGRPSIPRLDLAIGSVRLDARASDIRRSRAGLHFITGAMSGP